ncbi:MAG TPA: hypothetical protein VKR80_09210 [Candidatus Limnocylindria bacterium]|nr:hypothetical protein [Candidatus Limnocylindria bacterium]
MRDAFVFLTIAGLGMSVAGLAGLVTALRRSGSWDRTELWRLRNIARLGFLVVFLALVIFPIYGFLGDEVAALRWASGIIAALHVIEIVLARRDRVNWPGPTWVTGALVPEGLFALVSAANVALGSTALFEVGLLLRLMHPVNLVLLVLRSFDPAGRGT